LRAGAAFGFAAAFGFSSSAFFGAAFFAPIDSISICDRAARKPVCRR
jgi:hypothetical protein